MTGFDRRQFCLPIYNNEYANWMLDFDWTHTLTLSIASDLEFGACGVPPSIEQGQKFSTLADTLLYRLGERVYGRGIFATQIKHATFFEAWTRRGSPAHWHSHSLIAVAREFAPKLFVETQKQWGRLTGRTTWKSGRWTTVTGTMRLKPITSEDGGREGACRYATKFAHAAVLPELMQLPPADAK